MRHEGGHRAIWLVVLAAVSFNLVFLAPELTNPAPVLHDGVLHIAASRAAAAAIAAGQDPTDIWLPGVVLGYPLFHYYQHLPHVVTAVFSVVAAPLLGPDPPRAFFGFATWLLLGLFPVSVFWSARRFGFDRPAAACAALLAPLLSTNGLYGFEFGSYVWRGFGLYGQLWGMVLLPPALAQGAFVLRRGRGYFLAVVLLSLPALSNLVFAYIAFGSMVVLALLAPPREGIGRGLLRLVLLAVPLGLVTSYFLAPMLFDSAYFGRSAWWSREKFDSFGHERILGELFRGTLFDFGRFPSLTILAGLGAAVCVRSWRDERFRAPLILFGLWLALYFGRPTWGVLLDVTPMAREFHFHRLSAGVHLGGIYLMGVGLAAGWEWARSRNRTLFLAGAAAVTLALLYPVYRERITFLELNRTWMRNTRDAFAAEEKDLIQAHDFSRPRSRASRTKA